MKLLAALVVSAAFLSTGCDVRLDATQLTIDFENTGMVLVKVANAPPGYADRKEVPPGETVITIINRDFTHDHRAMVAKTDASPKDLPARLAAARSASDDTAEIVELSAPIERDKWITAGGQLRENIQQQQFHDYLAAGSRYLIMDPSLAGGYFVVVVPRASP